MAEPNDTATYLEDVSAIIQQEYFAEFEVETAGRFGSTTNRLFQLDSEAIHGDGRTMQVELAPADTVRMQIDPLGAFAAPDAFQATTIKVRWNKQTLTAHDFSEVSASAQVDDIDLRAGMNGAIVDFPDRIYRQIMPNYDEHLAILRHLPKTAVLGTVNGTTPGLNNNWYGASSGTVTNTGGLRCIVSGMSIAAIRPGTRLDFLNPTSFVVNAGNVQVTDVNPADKSIGVAFISTGITTRRSTGQLSNVSSTDVITFSNEYGKGMYSMGAYFGRPTAGESFIGGVDRSTSGYRWMLPTATREGSASAVVTRSMFNDAAIAMGFRSEDQLMGMVFMTDPTIHQSIRDQIGEDSFIQLPTDDSQLKRFGNFGSVGLNYQHGVFGMVKIAADPLCPPNTIRIIASKTWKSLYYGWKGLQFLPGERGNWYRLNENTPNVGRGKIYKCDAYTNQVDWCTRPWLNAIILNVTAS